MIIEETIYRPVINPPDSDWGEEWGLNFKYQIQNIILLLFFHNGYVLVVDTSCIDANN